VTNSVPSCESSEIELRELLRDVKLIGEIDLRLTGRNYLNARKEIDRLVEVHGRSYVDHVISQETFASYVIMLAGLAFSAYNNGTFWPNVRNEDATESNDASKLPYYKSDNDNRKFADLFLKCLEKLGKDDFSDEIIAENGLALLGPILLHAGLPASTVDDVWLLLLREFSEGASNAAEIVLNLRQDRVRIQYLDKPAQRFISYGGNFVVDLFQRMLNLIEDRPEFANDEIEIVAMEFGVPPLYLEKFKAIGSEFSQKKSISLPVPALIFDEYSLDGPFIELPSLRKEVARGKWRILGGVSSNRNPTFVVDASHIHTRQVHIRPDRFWNVIIETEDDRIRKSSFQSAAYGKALLFNALSGSYLHPRTAINCEEVNILLHKDIQFKGSMGQEEVELAHQQLPPIGGSWNDWIGYRVRIEGIDRLSLIRIDEKRTETIEDFAINKHAPSPELVGDDVEFFKDLDGGLVFSSIPYLKFPSGTSLEKLSMRIRFADGRVTSGLNLSEMKNEAGLVDFSQHVNDGLVSLTVFVQGAQLGSDFNARVVVVPKLNLQIEDRVFSPSEIVNGAILYENSKHDICFLEGEDYKQIELSDSHATLQFGLRISRLTHCVRIENEQLSFGFKPQTVTKEQFIGRHVSQIVARCYKDYSFQLHIQDSNGNVVASCERVQTLGQDKRVSIDLLRFIDEVNNTSSRLVTFFIYLGSIKIELLKVVTKYEVHFSDISVLDFASDQLESKIRFSFTESHGLGQRELLLRNIRNPWQADVIVQLDDGVRSHAVVAIPALIPGNYLVGMRSGDVDPLFTSFLQVGSDVDYERYISNLEPTTPESVAELICNGVSTRHDLLDAELANRLTTMLSTMLLNISKLRYLQDLSIIDLAISRLLDERLGGRPFIDWWFTSLSRNPVSNCLSVSQILISVYRTLSGSPLDAEVAKSNREDIWKLSPLFGAAIDVLDGRDDQSRKFWYEFVGRTRLEFEITNRIIGPKRHHDEYKYAELEDQLASVLIESRDGSLARYPILTYEGFRWSFYSYLLRVYEGAGISSENKIATQSRIWSNSEAVKVTVESILHLSEETQEFVQIAKSEIGLDSKYNVVSQVCALAFISMSYHPKIVRAKDDQKAAALLGQVYEIAPELVEYFLLLALSQSRFTS
jgi:hypothetical protein